MFPVIFNFKISLGTGLAPPYLDPYDVAKNWSPTSHLFVFYANIVSLPVEIEPPQPFPEPKQRKSADKINIENFHTKNAIKDHKGKFALG
jgi:hypothetical protein